MSKPKVDEPQFYSDISHLMCVRYTIFITNLY